MILILRRQWRDSIFAHHRSDPPIDCNNLQHDPHAILDLGQRGGYPQALVD
jgi:hypothetical protein